MAQDKDESKSVDVTKSDKSPDTSTRPLIVTNRSIIKDPMVKGEEDKSKDGKAEETKPVHREISIQPPGDVKADDQPTSKTADEEQKTNENQKTDQDSDAAKETADKKNEPDQGNKTSQAELDAIANQAGPKGKDKKAEEEAAQARKEAVNKLVESKKYFLPIGQITQRRHNRQALVVLILLLALVAAYLLADAEIINLPFELPVRIFPR